MTRSKRLCACAILMLLDSACFAQSYPTKPVRVIFAFAAGGAGDVIARAYGDKFTEKFGQGWVLDNRGGAGSTLGTAIAAKATPDGHTLFQANMTLCVSYAAYEKLPYDPARDFLPITTTVNVTSLKRTPAAPDIPSLAEQGLEGYDVVLWYGMLAPARTPKPIIDKLHAAFVEFAASPEVKEKLSPIGAEPASTSEEAFGVMIKRDIARWKKVARGVGIRL